VQRWISASNQIMLRVCACMCHPMYVCRWCEYVSGCLPLRFALEDNSMTKFPLLFWCHIILPEPYNQTILKLNGCCHCFAACCCLLVVAGVYQLSTCHMYLLPSSLSWLLECKLGLPIIMVLLVALVATITIAYCQAFSCRLHGSSAKCHIRLHFSANTRFFVAAVICQGGWVV